ncbi:unnamed protein product, partial [Cladocopium goreaui]
MTAWAHATLKMPHPEVFDALRQAAIAKIYLFKPQELNNLAWAYATLGIHSGPLFTAISDAAQNQVEEFKPQDLAVTALSFARLEIHDAQLMAAISAAEVRKMDLLQPQELGNTIWAFTKLMIVDLPLMHAISREAQRKIEQFSPQNLTNTVWSFAKVMVLDTSLLEAVWTASKALLAEFNAQNLSNTAWSLATFGISKMPCLEAIAEVFLKQMDKHPETQAVANVAWSFATLGYLHLPLLDAIGDHVLLSIHEYSGQGLANLVWAFSTLGYRQQPLVLALAQQACRCCREFQVQNLANSAWALANMDYLHQRCMDALAGCSLEKVSEMNPQALANIAWAWARLVLMSTPLLEALASESGKKMAEFQSQNISNLAWSAATLELRSPPLIQAIVAETRRKVTLLHCQDLANSAWSFARLAVNDEALLGAMGARVIATIEGLDELGLANTAWAFAKLELENLPLFQAMGCYAQKKITNFTTQNLANMAWSLARLGLVNRSLLSSVQEQAMRKMSECTAFDLSILVWSFDVLSLELPDAFMDRALYHFTKELELQGDVGMFWFDVANVASLSAKHFRNGEAFEQKFRERLLQPVEDSLRNLASPETDHQQSFDAWQSLVDEWNIPYLGPAYTKTLFQQLGVREVQGSKEFNCSEQQNGPDFASAYAWANAAQESAGAAFRKAAGQVKAAVDNQVWPGGFSAGAGPSPFESDEPFQGSLGAPVRIRVCSWNLHGNPIDQSDDIQAWLMPEEDVADVVVIAVQELVDLGPKTMARGPGYGRIWRAILWRFCFVMAIDVAGAALVLEVGSNMCRVGFAQQDVPSVVFPSLVGRIRHPALMQVGGQNQIYVGHDARARRGILHLLRPIERGLVTRWAEMEQIWHHIFYNELRVVPEEHPVLLLEAPLTPQDDRERMVQMMFETFGVPSLHLAMHAVLSLYASGRKTGIVLDCGLNQTRAVPVCEGIVLSHAVQRLPLGGQELNEHLIQLLADRGWCFRPPDFPIAEEIKETLCWVALDYQRQLLEELSQPYEAIFELPDGHQVTLGRESFQAPEAMFQPSLCGLECIGIHQLVFESIMASDEDLREELFSNVLLAGGSSLLRGLPERLQKDLAAMLPESSRNRVEVVAPDTRQHSAWIGGSMVASVTRYLQTWMTKEEFQRHGSSMVRERYLWLLKGAHDVMLWLPLLEKKTVKGGSQMNHGVLNTNGDEQRQMALESRVEQALSRGGQFIKVCSFGMVGLALLIYVQPWVAVSLRQLRIDRVKTGLDGIGGNKGGVCARFLLGHMSVCFVNVHLASGQNAVSERSQHFAQVLTDAFQGVSAKGAQRPKKHSFERSSIYHIAAHELCIIAGDFNSRLDLPKEAQWESETQEEWLLRDQIMLGQVSSLRGFREGVITFAPTYKYKIGTNMLNTKRAPAWCDRVVFKVDASCRAELLEYVSLPTLKLTSDHHPVTALFEIGWKK